MAINLDELETAAHAATPGPWRESPSYVPYGSVVSDSPIGNISIDADDHVKAYGGYLVAESVTLENRAFLAAANPEAVLELIDRVRIAERNARADFDRIANLEAQIARQHG